MDLENLDMKAITFAIEFVRFTGFLPLGILKEPRIPSIGTGNLQDCVFCCQSVCSYPFSRRVPQPVQERRLCMSQVQKKQGISTFDFFCIGVGAIIGIGWVVSINGWMEKCGGPAPAAVGYLLCLVMLIPVTLCYCELCPMLPVAGGGAVYAYRAFNEKVALISGWAVLGGFITIIPWEAIWVVDLLSILFPVLKEGAPLYILAGGEVYLSHIIMGTVFSVLLFVFNWRGAKSSATLQTILCTILIIVGVIAVVGAMLKFDGNNIQPIYENVGTGSHRSFFGGCVAMLASAPFFLAGFETIPQAVEEAGGSPSKVGKMVVTALTTCCLFYALLLFFLGGAMPWSEFIGVTSPAAANLYNVVYNGPLGTVLYYLLMIGALCGLFTSWNGFMLTSPMVMMSLARANLIPKCFAKQHATYRTPMYGLVLCLVLSILGPCLGMALIDPITTFSGGCFVLSWLLTSASAARLRKKEPELPRPYRMPGGIVTAYIAAVMMAILFLLMLIPGNPAYMGNTALIMFAVWMCIGIILYLVSGKERAQHTPEERAAALFHNMETEQELR